MPRCFRLFLPALIALLLVTRLAAAQSAERSYAVLSLIGDSVSIYTARQNSGIRLPGENKIVIDYPSSVLDQAVLGSADRFVKASMPGARTTLLMTQDLGLYKAQNAMFDDPAANKDNRAYLLDLLKGQKASHLLLVTKLRDNAGIKLANGSADNGLLDGLGFFVDDTVVVRSSDTRELRNGIVAPFAYVKVRLLDATTLAVLSEAKATESYALARPSTTDDAAGTWAAISDADKLSCLRQLIRQAVEAALPKVLPK